MEINVGKFNNLIVLRQADFGVYLDDGAQGILLPKRFIPAGLQIGDEIKVFVYHDSEGRLIATTQIPLAEVGDIIKLKVISTTPQGAFMDMGLMKDIFIPKSLQRSLMKINGEYIVKIIIDEQTGRLTATEKFENSLQNNDLSIKENDTAEILIWRRSDIGYSVIINYKHTGVLHSNEIYRHVTEGDKFPGFIKAIKPGKDNNFLIDVALGTRGYKRVEDESDKILRLLKSNDGFLPYHDKSTPEEIYSFFGLSKKTFKMTLGKLYKEKKIILLPNGIKIIQ